MLLTASGNADYGKEIFLISLLPGSVKLHSVKTILFRSKNASYSPEVLDIIDKAEALYFDGGDQHDYIKYWMNTTVQTVLQSKVEKVSFGGTSAGLAILGLFNFA